MNILTLPHILGQPNFPAQFSSSYLGGGGGLTGGFGGSGLGGFGGLSGFGMGGFGGLPGGFNSFGGLGG
ncbi:MAG: hypothetical protein L0Z62_02535, partial [Gemmataceae bacterium]|nr:hypothetical protein [Gemmataceae bacterium]